MRRLVFALALASAGPALADDTVRIVLQDGRFTPAEPHIASGKPFTIEFANRSATDVEFESRMLRVEQVVKPGGSAALGIRALAPGRYRFFDDMHEGVEGYLVVE